MGNVGRPKGYPKTGGRKKGTPNKKDKLGGFDTLAKLVEAMEDPEVEAMEDPERLKMELAELHGKDYFRVYCDLMAYLRPKFSSVEFNGNVKMGNEVTEALRKAMNNS